MSILAIVLIVVGVLLFLPSLFVAALKFLLWVGLILVVAGAVIWLFKAITGRNKTEV